MSAVAFNTYTVGVPVTIPYTLTVTPGVRVNPAFAVAFFNNNVIVVCPTDTANITKAVDVLNVNSLPTTLTYTRNVQNTGTGVLDLPVLTDTLEQSASGLTLTSGPTLTSGDINTNNDIDPGETWTYTATYDVTQINMDDAGDISNTATFSATFFTASNSNTVTTAITPAPSISVTTLADDITDVPAGQVVIYTYTVTNDGNQTVSAISLADVANGSGGNPVPGNEAIINDVAPLLDSTDAAVNGVWDSLAPGDSVTFTAPYTVTQSDIDTLQ